MSRGKAKPKPDDLGYVCGSKENAGVCATCPKWCRGRPAFDATLPKWRLERKSDQ